MAPPSPSEKRQQERFRLEPMYSSVTVQRVEGMALQSLEGHAYDISASGARIELDQALAVGERVALCLRLSGETGSIFVSGRVVWTHDDVDDPAARRMAVQFTRFLTPADRARLLRFVGCGDRRRAA